MSVAIKVVGVWTQIDYVKVSLAVSCINKLFRKVGKTHLVEKRNINHQLCTDCDRVGTGVIKLG